MTDTEAVRYAAGVTGATHDFVMMTSLTVSVASRIVLSAGDV